jgi:primosomal protein N' (replication factor Y)
VSNSEKRTKAIAEEMGQAGQFLLKKRYPKGIELLGPSTAPFSKMKGKYRWQMLAKGKNSRLLRQFARELGNRLEDQIKDKGVHLDIDVDPVFIL